MRGERPRGAFEGSGTSRMIRHAPRMMDHARVSNLPKRFTISSPESLFPTPTDLLQPGMPIWTPEDWHANRDKLRDSRRRTRKPRKSERAKIESFILCPTFLVPRNAKQRRGNCHNPIFTHRIFSSVGTQWRGDPDPAPYLGGNVCAEILSGPLQFGPRAKTLRQEVHFSYHMQLSDHQELLRSSRNLSQKMTPWHKERSNGLRSQDHILRTQARLCARPVPLENRVFLTRNKLIHKPGCVGKKTHSCTTWNSRIAKILSGSAGILIGKLPSNGPKTPPVASVRGNHISQVQARISANPEPCKSRQAQAFRRYQERQNPTSGARVFPARNKLIYEPGCVGKITTPATSWNSRFAESIPHLIGIFTGKVHENSSNAPTSGSHNSSHPNSDSCKLYTVGKRTSRAFRTICCMTHFEFQKTFQNCPRKSGQKENTRARTEEVQTAVSGGVHARRATITRRARSWRAPRARPPINKASPPLICTQFLLGL
uniref:Uncharacterized protein n=1 Tax=Fagus sylvatica TaxID=28930 RepID=A0A2N9FKU3_FAGSY